MDSTLIPLFFAYPFIPTTFRSKVSSPNFSIYGFIMSKIQVLTTLIIAVCLIGYLTGANAHAMPLISGVV